jgi:Ca2+-binding EF-hand superfamily protein
VNRLCELDFTLQRDMLFETLAAMDEDGSGSISLDEFLNFFGSSDPMEDDDYHKA